MSLRGTLLPGWWYGYGPITALTTFQLGMTGKEQTFREGIQSEDRVIGGLLFGEMKGSC